MARCRGSARNRPDRGRSRGACGERRRRPELGQECHGGPHGWARWLHSASRAAQRPARKSHSRQRRAAEPEPQLELPACVQLEPDGLDHPHGAGGRPHRGHGNVDGGHSFDGIDQYQQRYIADGGNQFSLTPPDQGLCVGNGYVVESVNDALQVFQKSGKTLTPPIGLNAFYGYPPVNNRTTGEQGPEVTDPTCYFDPQYSRWFQVALTLERDRSIGRADRLQPHRHRGQLEQQPARWLGGLSHPRAGRWHPGHAEPHQLPVHRRLPAHRRRPVRVLRDHQRVPVRHRSRRVREQLQRCAGLRALEVLARAELQLRSAGSVLQPDPAERHPVVHAVAIGGPGNRVRHAAQRHRVVLAVDRGNPGDQECRRDVQQHRHLALEQHASRSTAGLLRSCPARCSPQRRTGYRRLRNRRLVRSRCAIASSPTACPASDRRRARWRGTSTATTAACSRRGLPAVTCSPRWTPSCR